MNPEIVTALATVPIAFGTTGALAPQISIDDIVTSPGMPAYVMDAPAPPPATPVKHPPFPYIKHFLNSANFVYKEERHFPTCGIGGRSSDWICQTSNYQANAGILAAELGIPFVPVYGETQIDNWPREGTVPLNESMRPNSTLPPAPIPQPAQDSVDAVAMAVREAEARAVATLPIIKTPFLGLYNSNDYYVCKYWRALANNYNGHMNGGDYMSAVGYSNTMEEKQRRAKEFCDLPNDTPDLPIWTFEQIRDAIADHRVEGMEYPETGPGSQFRRTTLYVSPAPLPPIPFPFINKYLEEMFFLVTGEHHLLSGPMIGETNGARELYASNLRDAQAESRRILAINNDLPFYNIGELKKALIARSWETPAAPPVPALTGAELEKWLLGKVGKSLHWLITQCPQDPKLRGSILQKMGVWPMPHIPMEEALPAGCSQELMVWLRDNPKPPDHEYHEEPENGEEDEVVEEIHFDPPAAVAPPAPRPRTYGFRASYTENENGRCDFSRTVTRSGTARLTAGDIQALADDADGDRARFEELVRERVEEIGTENFEISTCDDSQYNDEEVTDSGGADNFTIENDFNAIIEEFLEEHPEVELE